MDILVITLLLLTFIGMTSMPWGECPKCGMNYYGWGLLNPKEHKCPDCGCKLEIKRNQDIISQSTSDKATPVDTLDDTDSEKK